MALQPTETLCLGMCHWTTVVAPLFLTPDGMTDCASAASVPLLQRSGKIQAGPYGFHNGVSQITCLRVWESFWNNAHTIRFPFQEMCQDGSMDNEGKAEGGYEDREQYSPVVLSYLILVYYWSLKKKSFQWEKGLSFRKRSQNVR